MKRVAFRIQKQNNFMPTFFFLKQTNRQTNLLGCFIIIISTDQSTVHDHSHCESEFELEKPMPIRTTLVSYLFVSKYLQSRALLDEHNYNYAKQRITYKGVSMGMNRGNQLTKFNE